MRADADFHLKTRMQGVFKSLGYYTRLEVNLAKEDLKGKRNDLTDLDVLAIFVAPDLSLEYVVADCTTNARRCKTPTERIFWLRGVMEFFSASKAYLVLGTNSQVPHAPRALATGLGIGVINIGYLSQQEKRVVGILPAELKVFLPEAWDYLEDNLCKMDSRLVTLVEYRRYDYWQAQTYQALQDLLNLTREVADLLDADQRFHRALMVDLLSLYSLALIQLAGHVTMRGAEDPADDVRAFLLGGESALRSKERQFALLREVVEHANRHQPQLFDTEELPSVDPEYLPALLDVVTRILNRPREATQIPNFLQAVLFEKVLNKDETADYHERAFGDITKKIARDIASFFVAVTGMDARLLRDFL